MWVLFWITVSRLQQMRVGQWIILSFIAFATHPTAKARGICFDLSVSLCKCAWIHTYTVHMCMPQQLACCRLFVLVIIWMKFPCICLCYLSLHHFELSFVKAVVFINYLIEVGEVLLCEPKWQQISVVKRLQYGRLLAFWHCSHSKAAKLSVCQSFSLSVDCCSMILFAAVGPAGRLYRSVAV